MEKQTHMKDVIIVTDREYDRRKDRITIAYRALQFAIASQSENAKERCLK